MKNLLICFHGKMGSGKTTAIEMLKAELKRRVTTVKFAQPLYDMQEFIYGRISSVVKRQEDFTKDRKLLQWLGTEWGRGTISENLWVNIWRKETSLQLAFTDVVCDDVRFDNEAETIKSLGGVIIHIRSKATDQRIDTKSGISNHASEAGIDPKYVDFTIDNDGTLGDLNAQLVTILKKLRSDLDDGPNNNS